MKFSRLFSNEKYKGTRNYLNSQRIYEIVRTALYFGISISLFISGWILVKKRVNLLTIVAVLGCLPASKSAVSMIMYLRYHSCSSETADKMEQHSEGLDTLYDLVFTSYDKNFQIAHIAVKGNTVCGFTEDKKFDEKAFAKHISGVLRTDGFKDVNVKIFTDLKKYMERLDQLKELETDETRTAGIMGTLKSVSL